MEDEEFFQLLFYGSGSFETQDLFSLSNPSLKELLQLNLQQQRFSYRTLQTQISSPKLQKLFLSLLIQATFDAAYQKDLKIEQRLNALSRELHVKKKGEQLEILSLPSIPLFSPFSIGERISFSNSQAAKAALDLFAKMRRFESFQPFGQTLLAVPLKAEKADWLPLQALLEREGNFSSWKRENFQAVKNEIQNLAEAKGTQQPLFSLLEQAYKPLAGQPAMKSRFDTLYFPTFAQLKVETLYVQTPWSLLLLVSSLLALFANLLFALKPPFRPVALIMTLLLLAFVTLQLAARIYILGRPPVSNMFETLLFVPFVALLISMVLYGMHRTALTLCLGPMGTLTLLVASWLGGFPDQLSQVQPVLNSQFWLTVHVLMVVSSYGAFLLAALLGHLFLLRPPKKPEKMLLGTLYTGTTLLVIGTLLGAVWANESWGRFWDWDPKESWAFISISLYVALIHLYRFKMIQHFGLSLGAVVGFLSITFTWYGVNYLLGVGLHSYGFGSGGENYYFSYLLLELLFIAAVWKWRPRIQLN